MTDELPHSARVGRTSGLIEWESLFDEYDEPTLHYYKKSAMAAVQAASAPAAPRKPLIFALIGTILVAAIVVLTAIGILDWTRVSLATGWPLAALGVYLAGWWLWRRRGAIRRVFGTAAPPGEAVPFLNPLGESSPGSVRVATEAVRLTQAEHVPDGYPRATFDGSYDYWEVSAICDFSDPSEYPGFALRVRMDGVNARFIRLGPEVDDPESLSTYSAKMQGGLGRFLGEVGAEVARPANLPRRRVSGALSATATWEFRVLPGESLSKETLVVAIAQLGANTTATCEVSLWVTKDGKLGTRVELPVGVAWMPLGHL